MEASVLEVMTSPKTNQAGEVGKVMDGIDCGDSKSAPGLDLDAWRSDLRRLHGTIDQVVQSFISSQTRQLDTVAAELSSQRERIVLKEQRFTDLSDSIAGFVEKEAQRLESLGLRLTDVDAEARQEAYDAELPGPPALHRINRLWRKATKAFESAQEANEREAASALEAQRKVMEARVSEVETQCNSLKQQHADELASLRRQIEVMSGESERQSAETRSLSDETQNLLEQLAATRQELSEKVATLDEAETARSRLQYQWDAEREEFERCRFASDERIQELERAVEASTCKEQELTKTCDERAKNLEQMRRVMDEQELELTQKIDRVQHYVKERQAGALQAEQKQKDAERSAERWQGEVRRLQAEKDNLAKLLLDLEERSSGQATQVQSMAVRHQQEVAALRDTLRVKEEEMRNANLELLQQRDGEYQAKVHLEKQREKDRSIALLRKKEQETQIKDQQLKAARSRIQELEREAGLCGGAVGGSLSTSSTQPATPCPSSRGSTATGSARGAGSGSSASDILPPLQMSAR